LCRENKRKAMEAGTAVPDRRDVDEAVAEATRRHLILTEARANPAPGTLPMPAPAVLKIALGCLIRDGFDKDKARDRLEDWMRVEPVGPNPVHFLLRRSRSDVWSSWSRRRMEQVAWEADQSVAALGGMDGRRHGP
jgi:hypothetical protein